jgi:membrane dipeptidase
MAMNTNKSVLFASFAAGTVLALCTGVSAAADNGSPQARALQARIITLDSHFDTPANFSIPGWSILDRHDPKTRSQVDYPRLVEGELDGGLWAIYTPQGGRTLADNLQSRDQGLKRLVEIRELLAAHPDRFELALTAEDAPRIKKEGKRIVYISVENASPLASDPTLLSAYYKLGVRVLGLVHTSNNDFADSATDKPEWHGLSPKGRALVAQANRLGIVLDQSHASDEVFDQLLEVSKAPIILSHTSSSAIHVNPRNIDDQRIRALAAKGGVIQVNSLSGYLIDGGETPEYHAALRALREDYNKQPASPTKDQEFEHRLDALNTQYKIRRATFDDYVTHILHILKVAGPDHVGFGADWDGGGGVTGLEDVSQLPKITDRLVQAGYTERQIANIWGGNLLRVIRQAQALAENPPPTDRSPTR